jgi:hypothetical protein
LVPSPSNFKPAAAAAAAAAAVDSSCNSSATSKSQNFGLIKRHSRQHIDEPIHDSNTRTPKYHSAHITRNQRFSHPKYEYQ